MTPKKQSHLLNLLNYALLYGDNLSSYLEMKLPVLLVKTQSFVSFQEIGVQMYTYKAGQRA